MPTCKQHRSFNYCHYMIDILQLLKFVMCVKCEDSNDEDVVLIVVRSRECCINALLLTNFDNLCIVSSFLEGMGIWLEGISE